MYNQQNNQLEVISKPKTLCLLFVFVIIQLCLVIASLILQGVMGYIGFEKASQKISISSNCSDSYSNKKFSDLLQYPMSIAFVFGCIACFFALIMFVLVLKPLIGQHLVEEHMNSRKNKERTEINLLQIFVSMKLSAAWYIVQSLVVISVAVVFGTFLTYQIQVVLLSKCSFTTNSDQILAITIVSGVALIASLICWIIIFCISVNLNKALKALEKGTIYEIKSPREKDIEMEKIEKVSEKKNENVKDQAQEKQELQSGRNLNPNHNPYVAKEIRQPFLDEKKSSHHDSRVKQKSEPEQQKSDFQKSVIRKNPVYFSRKDIYESPYSRIQSKPFYQPESPRNEIQQEKYEHRQIKYTQSRAKLKQQQESYLDRSSRRMIPEGGLYEGHRNRLHSTYFREQSSIGKSKYKKSPGRGGILTEYIHGRYVQQ